MDPERMMFYSSNSSILRKARWSGNKIQKNLATHAAHIHGIFTDILLIKIFVGFYNGH